jgi:hypothetical protein
MLLLLFACLNIGLPGHLATADECMLDKHSTPNMQPPLRSEGTSDLSIMTPLLLLLPPGAV